MMAARSGRSYITDILLEGGVIDLDIQENVRSWYSQLSHNTSLHSTCIITQHGLPARIVLSLLILIVYYDTCIHCYSSSLSIVCIICSNHCPEKCQLCSLCLLTILDYSSGCLHLTRMCAYRQLTMSNNTMHTEARDLGEMRYTSWTVQDG